MRSSLTGFLQTHQGKSIKLRLVEFKDAQFLLNLRLDKRYNKYLSIVSPSLVKQRQWLEQYKQEEQLGKQYYFIIEKLDNSPCGAVRIYDLLPDSFCWGSWILNENKTLTAAIESMMLVYTIGFNFLGFELARFDVRKDNLQVLALHKNAKAQRINEDNLNYYFHFDLDMYKYNLRKLRKFLF